MNRNPVMKTIARLATIAFPFTMSAFALYIGVSKVNSIEPAWSLLIGASILGAFLSSVNAHVVIDGWK